MPPPRKDELEQRTSMDSLKVCVPHIWLNHEERGK